MLSLSFSGSDNPLRGLSARNNAGIFRRDATGVGVEADNFRTRYTFVFVCPVELAPPKIYYALASSDSDTAKFKILGHLKIYIECAQVSVWHILVFVSLP